MNKNKVGLVVAIEIEALFKMYDHIVELDAPIGFKVYKIEKEDIELYVIRTGMGECYASAGVQYLITKYDVKWIVNFGVVGGLTNEMKKHKLCIVDKVVHYKYDCHEFMDLKVGQVDGHDSIYLKTNQDLINKALNELNDISLVTCCSGDKFVATPIEKEYLHNTFNGDICDMESSGIVLTCELNNIPCILFKGVSDGLADGAKGFYDELQDASIKILQVVDKIITKLN